LTPIWAGKVLSLAKGKLEAAKAVVKFDPAILKAETVAGMCKKPIEEIAKSIHYEPLPDEAHTLIVAAWQRGGLLPRAAVEQSVPSKRDVVEGTEAGAFS
jgi:hypothetical protein